MGDTYATASEAEADRGQQQALLAALNATERALRRDECGAWRINGRNDGTGGSIHTWGDGNTWVLYVRCRSVRHWTAAKKRLGFCVVSRDGDDEGCLRLLNLPTPDQAEVIRDSLGIRKKQEISDETRERLKAFAFERKTRSKASLVQNNAIAASPLPEVPQEKTPIPDAGLAK
jgi:hypothetical protein